MVEFIKCHAGHPHRPVNWRWQRARYLRENRLKGLSRKHDDQIIADVLRFQKQLYSCKSDMERYALLDRHAVLYYAYALWDEDESDQSRWQSNPAKFEIEARLLADESAESIADRLGTTAPVIEMYEKVFFNISDRMKNPGYILHQVMGPSVHRGLTNREYDVLWKLLGYFAGPLVLNAFITSFVDSFKVERADQVDDFCKDWTKSNLNMKAAIAARTLDVNSYTQVDILELHAKFKELEANHDPSEARNTIVANIGVMMKALPWSVGTDKLKEASLDPKLLEHYDKPTQGELRANEVLDVSINNADMPDLSAFVYPEERRRGSGTN